MQKLRVTKIQLVCASYNTRYVVGYLALNKEIFIFKNRIFKGMK